tara:strand:- start:418 stop:771 length:354 start_codon:yes stop_codon:yes gene_type:complete
MPATLTFSAPLNVSCQIGDTVYYVPTSSSGGFNINSAGVVEIGIVSGIGGTTAAPTITVANNQVTTIPNGAFILFSKDNKANMSSALGYYCEVKLKNTSTNYSELFSVGMDIFESSK